MIFFNVYSFYLLKIKYLTHSFWPPSFHSHSSVDPPPPCTGLGPNTIQTRPAGWRRRPGVPYTTVWMFSPSWWRTAGSIMFLWTLNNLRPSSEFWMLVRTQKELYFQGFYSLNKYFRFCSAKVLKVYWQVTKINLFEITVLTIVCPQPLIIKDSVHKWTWIEVEMSLLNCLQKRRFFQSYLVIFGREK